MEAEEGLVDLTVAEPIGAGKFGAIFTVPRNPLLALKIVKKHSQTASMEISQEFEHMVDLWKIRRLLPQLFQMPRPIGYQWNIPERKIQTLKYSKDSKYERLVNELDMAFDELNPSNHVIVMERIAALPRELSETIVQQFSSAPFGTRTNFCRLYFGKNSRTKKTNSPNLADFPIFLNQYHWLQHLTSTRYMLPKSRILATEMGRMLASVHLGGKDGRGIEFILAGSSEFDEEHKERLEQLSVYDRAYNDESQTHGYTSWAFYTLDFNKVQALHLNSPGLRDADIQQCANAFFANDPYFPRPRVQETLYKFFKRGYYSVMQPEDPYKFDRRFLGFAPDFFAEIEERQAQKDGTEDSQQISECSSELLL